MVNLSSPDLILAESLDQFSDNNNNSHADSYSWYQFERKQLERLEQTFITFNHLNI